MLLAGSSTRPLLLYDHCTKHVAIYNLRSHQGKGVPLTSDFFYSLLVINYSLFVNRLPMCGFYSSLLTGAVNRLLTT